MEGRGALLAVAVPLIAFKIWFAILLLSYSPTHDAVVWIAATHWPLVFVIAALVLGPGIAIYRLVKVRARRDALKRSEWMVETRRGPQCSALWDTVSRLEGGD
jgi:TRAP-type C4-dicarboxylate transport system permease small subunit